MLVHFFGYCRLFQKLYKDEDTKLITIKTQSLRKKDKFPQYTDDILSSQESRFCSPLTVFQSAFDKVHQISHAVVHVAQKNFIQYFYIVYRQKWLFVFSLVCLDCQMHSTRKMNKKKAAILPFSKLSNHTISMDTKSPLNLASERNC